MNTYSINISQHGQHWARMLLPDTDHEDACAKAQQTASRFLQTDGFKVTLSEWTEPVGRDIHFY